MMKNYPGTLFLVIGNSGSGKDSIITGTIKKYPKNNKKIHLAKRFITRPPSENEDNHNISCEKFQEMVEQNLFSLYWNSYGLNYGVPIEIDDKLKKGENIIANVSREVVWLARKNYKNIKVIFIEVPFNITKQRIKKRGREDGKKLEERLTRAKANQKFTNADHIVNNSKDLEYAIEQFLNIINKY